MTLEDFDRVQPYLARYLRMRLGVYSGASYNENASVIVDGVYQSDDGRWEAHYTDGPSWEVCQIVEARCHPHCQRGVGGPHVWVSPDHRCCKACEIDSGHHYKTVHE